MSLAKLFYHYGTKIATYKLVVITISLLLTILVIFGIVFVEFDVI